MDTAQLDLESYQAELATTARDSSVRAALQNANADPDTELARQALEDRIASGLPFTTDSLPHPAGRGVMGALIQQAIKRGRIESVGRTRSKRLQAHGRHIDIWRAKP